MRIVIFLDNGGYKIDFRMEVCLQTNYYYNKDQDVILKCHSILIVIQNQVWKP